MVKEIVIYRDRIVTHVILSRGRSNFQLKMQNKKSNSTLSIDNTLEVLFDFEHSLTVTNCFLI